MKVAIGCDHAGYEMKCYLSKELTALGYNMIDCGTDSTDPVDYPDFALKVCSLVKSGDAPRGIVVCSTGIGVSITANKIRGIRAALCHTEFSAYMARHHNDANILALGAAVIGNGLALAIAKMFLNEKFSNEERHIRRIHKLQDIENMI